MSRDYDGAGDGKTHFFCAACDSVLPYKIDKGAIILIPCKCAAQREIKVEHNTQQLKSKISEFRESLKWYRDNVDRVAACGFINKLDEIQKLSAV